MRPNIWLTEDKTIEFIDKYINGIKDYDLAKYFNLSDRHVEKLIKIYIEDDVKKQVFENRYEEAAKYFKKDPKKYSAPKLAEIYCVPVKNLKNRLEDNGLRQKQTQSKVYTNEEFADIANKIHNNLYDYSEVEYKNNYTKVKIKCKIHGVFEQMPQNHLRPQGCPECAGFKKDTVIAKWTEEQKDQMVIEYTINGKTGKEIAEIFGGHENSVLRMLREERKCIMLTNKIPLEIAEVIIKEFQNSEKPNIEKIAIKFNCSKKYVNKLLNERKIKRKKTNIDYFSKDRFIKRAKLIHGNKFGYDKVEAAKYRDIIKIYCNSCKDYWSQEAASHLKGYGCPKCSGRIGFAETFMARVKEIHGDKFDYTNTIYVNKRTPITVKCNIHNEYIQALPRNHLLGQGCCRQCWLENLKKIKTKPIEEYLRVCKDNYNNAYNYDKTDFSEYWITVNCPKHGDFTTRKFQHFYGKSPCSGCKDNHSSKKEKAWLTHLNVPEAFWQKTIRCGVKTYVCDAFDKENKIVYEFHGDYWHGNPNTTKHAVLNKNKNKTFGELYEATLEKEDNIRKAGYKLIVMWEEDWNKLVNDLEE